MPLVSYIWKEIYLFRTSKIMGIKTIGLEGVSSVGKTTLLSKLSNHFEIIPEFTEAPNYLKGIELHKYFLEMNHSNLMKDNLNSHSEVLCFDRTIVSTIIYTFVLDKLNNTNYFVQLVEDFPELLIYPKYYPQLTILLDIDPINTLDRIMNKFKESTSDWNNPEFLNLFDQGIKYFVENILPSDYAIVETSGKDINELFKECSELIDNFEANRKSFEPVTPELLLTLEEIL